MKYVSISYPDVNNGLGCRVTLWVSGCVHKCKGCQNQETWNFDCGHDFTDEVMEQLFDVVSKPYIKGLTLSGGDPLCSYNNGIVELLEKFRERFGNTKDIWVYSGFTYPIIKKCFPRILDLVDYIVDGKYFESQRDVSLAFRGSKNQIIWEKDEDGKFFVSKLN